MNQANGQTSNNQEVRRLDLLDKPTSIEKNDLLKDGDVLPDQKIPENRKINIHDIEGFFEEVSTTPTHTPKNFWDSFKIYDDELYVFSPKTHTWNAPTTTVSAHYATGVGTITATGNINVTSLSFTPTFLKITAQAENGYGSSIGTYTANEGVQLLFRLYDGTDYKGGTDGAGSHIINIWDDTETNQTTVEFTALVSNGFSLNCDEYNVETDYLWEAYG